MSVKRKGTCPISYSHKQYVQNFPYPSEHLLSPYDGWETTSLISEFNLNSLLPNDVELLSSACCSFVCLLIFVNLVQTEFLSFFPYQYK